MFTFKEFIQESKTVMLYNQLDFLGKVQFWFNIPRAWKMYKNFDRLFMDNLE